VVTKSGENLLDSQSETAPGHVGVSGLWLILVVFFRDVIIIT